MVIKVAKVPAQAGAVKASIVKKKAAAAPEEEGEEKECKWCEKGECWSHGQIEKPKSKGKGKGKGKYKGGGGWGGGGGGGDGGVLGLLSALLGGGGGEGGGKSYGKGCKWCSQGQCWTHGGKGGGKGGGSWASNFKVDKSGGELGEFTGTIKSFVRIKNYGFIECEELTESYGDVFLHGNMKKGYREGNVVKFTAVLNKDGKAVATDLKSGLK